MNFITSVFKPAMLHLKLATPTESDLDKLKRQRTEISQKLTLTDSDRATIKRLDETLELLESIS